MSHGCRGRFSCAARVGHATCCARCNVTVMRTVPNNCPVCGEAIPADVAAVRAQVTRRNNRRGWGWPSAWTRREPVCQSCAGKWMGESVDGLVRFVAPSVTDTETVSCQACDRLVMLTPDSRRKVNVCSDSCRMAYYAGKRVPIAVTHRCEGCGVVMHGRADRKFCSAACRQRAYRVRA